MLTDAELAEAERMLDPDTFAAYRRAVADPDGDLGWMLANDSQVIRALLSPSRRLRPTTPFASWRSRLGLTQQAASDALGLHLRTVQRYDAGEETIPRSITLACAYLELSRALRLYESLAT